MCVPCSLQRFLLGCKQINYTSDKGGKRLCKGYRPCQKKTSARSVGKNSTGPAHLLFATFSYVMRLCGNLTIICGALIL